MPLLRRSGEALSSSFKTLAEKAEADISHLVCEHCDFKGQRHLPLYHSPLEEDLIPVKPILLAPSKRLRLTDLPYDILIDICDRLEPRSLINLCTAYPPLHQDLVTTTSLLGRSHIQCFYLRTSPHHPLSNVLLPPKLPQSSRFRPILGVTTNWIYSKVAPYRELVSDFSLLSLEAYNEFGIRKNASGRKVDFYLALPFGLNFDAFERDENGKCMREVGRYEERVVAKIWKSWGIMGRQVRSHGNSDQAQGKATILEESRSGKNLFDKVCDSISLSLLN